MAVKNAMSGKDTKLAFRQNNVPRIILCKSHDLQEVADESVDEVNGEDRGRPQTITDYFTIQLDMYMPDMQMLDAHLEYIKQADANGIPFNISMGIRFYMHDLTRAAYVLSEGTRGPFKQSSPGRKERAMFSCAYKFRRFLPTVAA